MELEKLIQYRDKAITELEKVRSYLTKHIELDENDYEIRSRHFKVRDLETKIASYEKKIAIAKTDQELVVPVPIQIFADHLIENWNNFDFRMREFYKTKLKELGYRDFFKHYNGSNYELIHSTDESIINKNKRSAKNMIMKLIHQAFDKIGRMTDATCLTVEIDNHSIPTINGIIIGEKGKVKITSILAGGYNIQRLHVRLLVKSL